MNPSTNSTPREQTAAWLPAVALLCLLTAAVPVVVCMPLTSDTVLFDLQAKTVLDGGVLYRDIMEPNLPGVVWIHLAIRWLGGWSSEWMRLADLLIVGLAAAILARLATAGSAIIPSYADTKSKASRMAALCQSPSMLPLLFMSLFYLSRNEWCHCQRDSWLLLPSAMAMTVRLLAMRQADRRASGWLAVLEGILWGAAFWIKPHVAVSVVSLILTDVITAGTGTARRQAAGHSLLIILGGLMAAIPGFYWLISTDAWAPFREMQLQWNPEYLQAGRERRTWTRIGQLLIRFHPWWGIHLLAIPAALRNCRPAFRSTPQQCVGVVYLSWLAQTCLLQHAMDYVQVPPILLGIAVLSTGLPSVPAIVRRPMVCAAATIAIIASPELWPERLVTWSTCLRQGSSWQLKSQLAQGRFPNWIQMQNVVDFLTQQKVRSGDVTCFNVHSIHIYDALKIRPSTRYLGVSVLLQLFPGHQQTISDTVKGCGHRFVVTDSDESAMQPGEFPWNLPVVFQAGNFRVHQVESRTASQPESILQH
jgi:hypothetical protein